MVCRSDSNFMSSKRLKNSNDMTTEAVSDISLDRQILSSDINDIIQASPVPTTYPYHTSACGSILYSNPTKSAEEIFSLLRHADFDAFRRSLDVYHQDIIRIKNNHEQSVLHVLVIHAYPYIWVRLLMMRGCDTCLQDADGYTAAHYAVERDDVEMLKALTVRFQSQARPISEEQVTNIHQRCLHALTVREKRGLTVFMLACYRDSMKCLTYLLELNINDSQLQDNFGDTCLHYAVAHKNQALIEKLVQTCQVDVNGGDVSRPSVLDIFQFNRQNLKPNEQDVNDKIEQYLLRHHARNRCAIRRVINKRKGPNEPEAAVVNNLSSLSLDPTTNGQIETARSHARLAEHLQSKGDLNGAKDNYRNAMKYTLEETLDWTNYAYHLAMIYQTTDEQQAARELLEKALEIRIKFEVDGEYIDRLKQAMDMMHQSTS